MSITFKTDHAIPQATMLKHPAHCLSFGFGSGLSPYAPGTTGTLAAIPLYYAMTYLPMPVYLILLVGLFMLGVYVCEVTTRALGVQDHRAIVWDEFVGYLITMILVPAGWMWIILGFFMFRFFDVVKHWPANWMDKHVKGGLGIMLDDVVAGVYALISMHIAVYAYHHYLQGS